MNILDDIQRILNPLNVPFETGIFTEPAPEQYLVIVPLIDKFELYADNLPLADVQEARISVYSQGNYQRLKKQVISAFLEAGYIISQRQYIGYETETGYFHYNIDVTTFYETEETT